MFPMRICFFVTFTVLYSVQALSQQCDDEDTCTVPYTKGKRGTMMFQKPDAGPATGSASAAASKPLVIALQRVRTKRRADDRQSFYIGNVSVGYPPRRFSVAFDTSSGHVLLPLSKCKSKACVEHNSYSAQRSKTSVHVNFDGSRISRMALEGRAKRDALTVEFTQSDLGTGNVSAALIRDRVCMVAATGNKSCAATIMAVAWNMSDVPFRAMPNDGIVGLGLRNLSASPACNFFEQLLGGSTKLLPQFGMHFSRGGGELHIGGYDTASIASPMQWFSVHSPQDGYWQVPILAVRVGSKTVFSCDGGCHGIMDSTASRLGLQEAMLPQLRTALTSSRQDGLCQGPALEFDLGAMSVKLGPEDYADETCVPDLGPLEFDRPIFAFGESVLRQYFIAFDWKDKRIGFALPSKIEPDEQITV